MALFKSIYFFLCYVVFIYKLVEIIKKGDGKTPVEIITLKPEERAAFVKATASVRATVKAKSASTKAIVEIIEAGLADFKAKSSRKTP